MKKNETIVDSPSVTLILPSLASPRRTKAALKTKLEDLISKRAELAMNPETTAECLARYDEAIKNIRSTLTGNVAKNCRVR